MQISLRQSYEEFDPDALDRPVVTLRVDTREKENELPMHSHRKGQLVLALRGGVTCEVATGLWMVPPRCGVWISRRDAAQQSRYRKRQHLLLVRGCTRRGASGDLLHLVDYTAAS